MKTIAVIHFGKIGDTINASPVCVELKKAYPNSKLIFITVPEGLETAKCLLGVDEIFVYEKDTKHRSLTEFYKFIISVKMSNKIDMAVILTDTFRAALLAFLIGAKKRIGRASDFRSFLLTHKVFWTEEDHKANYSDSLMRVLKPIGLYNPVFEIKLKYSEEDMLYTENILKESGYYNYPLVGICPCAITCDSWKPEEAAKLIKYINSLGYKVVIIGDKTGQKFVQNIKKLGESYFLDMTDKTSIPQLIALISKLKRFISIDTGPAHIAYALKIPTVTLFLREYSKCWKPENLDINSIVYDESMNISAQKVIDELKNLDNKLEQKCNLI